MRSSRGSVVGWTFFKGFLRNDLSHCRMRGSSGGSRMSVPFRSSHDTNA